MTTRPRRLLATADLHFGLHPDGNASTLELARHVCASDADVFAIAGDVGDLDVENFQACLRLFEQFDGLKLLVPGNHDLWTTSTSSKDKYKTVLPRIASECGFKTLDVEPAVAGDVAFIGNIGWYDYSFHNPDLKLSVEDYRRKSLPGVCSWNDGVYIRWEWEDEEFTQICLCKLSRHYSEVQAKARQVVAVLHHVPFAELLYETGGTAAEFCRAYMGSERFGNLLLRCPKVRFVICGHRHGPDSCQQGSLKAFVAGSEYGMKRLLNLDLETGVHSLLDFGSSRRSADMGAMDGP